MAWTLRLGGWPRYIATALAGMYRTVFGVTEVRGPIGHDYAFIPSREPPALRRRKKRKAGGAGGGASAAAAVAEPADAAAAVAAGGGIDGTSGGGGGAAAAAEAVLDDHSPFAVPAAGEAAAAAAGPPCRGGGAAQHLSAVVEEADSDVATYGDADEDGSDADLDAGDPMAATRQAVLAACATVPACGGGGSGGAEGAGGAAAAGGGDAAAPGGGSAPHAPPLVHDRGGVLRVAAVALGRTLSYRPSAQLSANLEGLLGPSGSFTTPAGAGAGAGLLGAAAGGPALAPRPSGGLTKSSSVRPLRSVPAGALGGGGPLEPAHSARPAPRGASP
jgi:hypothetical protein